MTSFLLLAAMPDEAAAFLPGTDFEAGRAHPLPGTGVIAVTGIGAVNAAVRATRLIGELEPGAVVSVGSAGGLGADVRVGDVVVGSEYRYHQADATAFGYELGQIPGMPAAYLSDPELLARARGLDVHVGGMLSGDSFVAAHLVGDVRASFPGALATDMESVALAQACHLLGVPFISVRAISDLCDGSADESFRMALPDVAARCAQVTRAILD